MSRGADQVDPMAVGRTTQDADPSSAAARARRHRHLNVEERVARGKAARSDAPRSSHGKWAPEVTRPDPVALLGEQAETRVPELVPIRHGRMLVSPFTFFRGAALIMAADLATTPALGRERPALR